MSLFFIPLPSWSHSSHADQARVWFRLDHFGWLQGKDYRYCQFQAGVYAQSWSERHIECYFSASLTELEKGELYERCYRALPDGRVTEVDTFVGQYGKELRLLNFGVLVFKKDSVDYSQKSLTWFHEDRPEDCQQLEFGYSMVHRGVLYWDTNNEIVSRGENLNERWRYRYNDLRADLVNNRRCFFGDDWLFHVQNSEDYKHCDIYLISLEDGQRQKQFTVNHKLLSAHYLNGKLYLGSDTLYHVLNVHSGEIELTLPNPFGKKHMELVKRPDGSGYQTASGSELWCDGHLLYLFGNEESTVHIHNLEGEYLTKVDVPEGYKFMARFDCKHAAPYSYIPLGPDQIFYNNAKQAMLVVDVEALLASPETAEPQWEPAPWQEERKIVLDKQTHAYEFHIDAMENPHDMLRYAEIGLKTIAARYGTQVWTNKRNRKFNGEITLVVHGTEADRERLSPWVSEAPDRMAFFCRSFGFISGNRKAYISGNLRWEIR